MPHWLRPLLSVAILAALGLFLATYTLAPLRRGQWAIADDHEIAHFVGASGQLPFRDIPEKLQQTEIGRAGRHARFRPSYYGLRLVESSLWGLEAAHWYRARVVLYAVSVLLVGWVVAARIGLLATVGLLIWVFSGRYWFHVWGRLGPAESYAMFGAALWLYGIHLLWPVAEVGRGPRWRLVVGLVLFVIGNAVVIGVKESLLVLAVPNVLLAVVETRAGRSGGARWWACVTGVVAAVAVATPLAIYYSSIELDQYGRSVDPLARLRVLARGARRLTAVHVAFLLALAVWIGTRVVSRIGAFSPSAAWRRLTSQSILASAGALGLFLVQFVLYNGDITPDTHYEFPTSLLAPAVLVATAILVRGFLQRVGASRAERVVYHVTGLVLVGLALLSADGLREQRTMARNWAKGTEDFTTAMRQAAAAARTAPDIPVVVTSGRPLDIEPILAVGRFLQVWGAANPRFLVLDWESDRGQWNALDRHLAPDVEGASRDGGLGYEPIARLRPEAPCFSIGLRTAPRPTCRSLGRLL